jgi:hypothetical protein
MKKQAAFGEQGSILVGQAMSGIHLGGLARYHVYLAATMLEKI